MFDYYYKGDVPVYPLPRQRPLDPAKTQADLELLLEHEKIYALYWAADEADPEGVIESWLDQKGYKTLDQWHGNVRLAVYVMPERQAPEEVVDDLNCAAGQRDHPARVQQLEPGAGRRRSDAGAAAVAGGRDAGPAVQGVPAAARPAQPGHRAARCGARGRKPADDDLAAGRDRPRQSRGAHSAGHAARQLPAHRGPVRRRDGRASQAGGRQRLHQPAADQRATRQRSRHPSRRSRCRTASSSTSVRSRLLGHDRYKRGFGHAPDTPVKPGDLLHLTFYWRANVAPRADWWFELVADGW